MFKNNTLIKKNVMVSERSNSSFDLVVGLFFPFQLFIGFF
ncbi:hypothetical protein HMPREF1981_03391 [Bacteroides pyogenes F0041]|uniref:Uncharacterized protein n=1 Tax=Bacteroides pyogenes F0041 TaxID=1321819 RepID=U2BSE8_9BACE|nr:hypothetical protein HMPREF1981_03391 [Bacteroides pyogenes F0041]